MKMITTRQSGSRPFWVTALVALPCAVALSIRLAAHAAPLSAGSAMPPLSLSDQHDKPAAVGPSTRWVVFTAEKAVSDMVSAALAAEPAGIADRLRLVYVADISRMPPLATRMFALPKLRELPFPIALVRDPAQVTQVSDIPRVPGSATVLRIDAGHVAQVVMARQAAELRAALGLPAVPATP